MTRPTTPRIPRFLLAATATLAVAGFYGGLVRIGVPLPHVQAPADLHGLIMMQGVFGTLIPLERAVALKSPVWFIAPLLSVLATALLLAGAPAMAGLSLYGLAAIVFTVMSAHIVKLQPAPFTVALLLGAASLAVAAILLIVNQGEASSSVPWWLAYLIVTVTAERLELSRFAGHGRATAAMFFVVIAMLLAGAAIGLDGVAGPMVLGTSLLLLAVWLWHFDIARRTVRTRGQTRFMGAAILCGHAWLAIAGLVALALPGGAVRLDALIHAVTIGFALSMVMGHALIILPAVAAVACPYSPAMFAPLVVLQAAVGWRMIADWLLPDARWLSGVLTVLALAGFVALVIAGRGSRRQPAVATRP